MKTMKFDGQSESLYRWIEMGWAEALNELRPLVKIEINELKMNGKKNKQTKYHEPTESSIKQFIIISRFRQISHLIGIFVFLACTESTKTAVS